jgi:hypothetical protein
MASEGSIDAPGGAGPSGQQSTTDGRETAAEMARIVADLDYDNFKRAVAREQGSRQAEVYGCVWADLRTLQDRSRQ